MPEKPDPTELLERLRLMMEEPSSPDLTLTRSGELRPRIARLLEILRSTSAPACC